jgi:hypothetical protein
MIWEAESDAGRRVLVDDEQNLMRITDGARTIEITSNAINVMGASINLGGTGGQPVARQTDSVEVTIPPGAVLVSIPATPFFAPNPAPITLSGTITAGSSGVKST